MSLVCDGPLRGCDSAGEPGTVYLSANNPSERTCMHNSTELQIEVLDSMRIARVCIESESPETKAFQALADWAEQNEPEPWVGATTDGSGSSSAMRWADAYWWRSSASV